MTPSSCNPKRVVVFDMDDTLFLERDFVRSGYNAVCHHMATTGLISFTEAENARAWLWQRFEAGQSEGAFNALSELFLLDLNKQQIMELVDVYRQHQPDIDLIEGMKEVLDQIAVEDHVSTGLITDGPADMQRSKFDALGLKHWIDYPMFTATLPEGSAKPSQRPYTMIEEHFGCRGTQCLYVADNVKKDFFAPNTLSWHSILFRHPGQIYTNAKTAENGSARLTFTTVDALRTWIVEEFISQHRIG